MTMFRVKIALMAAVFAFLTSGCAPSTNPLSNAQTAGGNLPPVFSGSPAVSAIEGVAYTFQAVATDPDGDVVTLDLVAGPAGMSAIAGLVTWTPVSGQVGNHAATLAASDGTAITSLDWVISVAPAITTSAPVINSVAPITATVGQAYMYQVLASGMPAPAITVSGNPAWLTFDAAAGTLSGTPTASDAGVTGSILVSAVNGVIPDAIEPFSITVAAAPPPGAVPVVTISTPFGVYEGAAGSTILLTFEVSLDIAATQTTTVDVTTSDGTASATSGDYVTGRETVTFAAGEWSKNFTITINGDNSVELNETIVATLSNPVNATLGTPLSGTGTIINDDVVTTGPDVSIADVTVAEGPAGVSTPAVFTISLSEAATQSCTVDVWTADGTATLSNSDYSGGAATISFSIGDTSKTFTVSAVGDNAQESSETVEIHLGNATGGLSIAVSQALLTISDDDALVTPPGVMIVWGGSPGGGSPALSNGGCYNPTTDTWTQPAGLIGGANRPSGRCFHTSVWTGATGDPATANKMIAWGGASSGGTWAGGTMFADGAIYDSATDMWSAPAGLSSGANCPSYRAGAVAVWTGSTGSAATSNKMIVWGGWNGSPSSLSSLGDGAVYDPAIDTWSAPSGLSTSADRPSKRGSAVAVWTGTKMIVWGGYNGAQYLGSGAAYDLASDTWTVPAGLNGAGAPSGCRWGAAAAFTGSVMLVWGGHTTSREGATYDPVSDIWTTPSNMVSDINLPAGRGGASMAWTGVSAIVWGGIAATGSPVSFRNGGVYVPSSGGTWHQPAGLGSHVLNPTVRTAHTAVWAGN